MSKILTDTNTAESHNVQV